MGKKTSAVKAATKYLGHGEDGGLTVIGTDGAYVIGKRGRRYIDFQSGWCVGNFGWSNKLLRDCIRTYDGPAYVYPEHLYKPWTELAELLAKLAPGKLQKCFRATGGTEAVDLALQMAMRHTGRREFIGLSDAYHGNSLATISIGADAGKRRQLNLLSGFHQIDPPLDETAADKIETLLKRRKIAAVILEPISCNLDVLVPDARFMLRVQRLCRRHGALFIMDEVACGFGRTGKLFASEHFDIAPDIMCLAKAITGGYAPMGATLATSAVARSMEKDGEFYSTYGWHPLPTHVALANIRYIRKNKTVLLHGVARLSARFRARLSAMAFKEKPEVRIKGLAIAICFGKKSYAEAVRAKCEENGLIVAGNESICLFPPLNLDPTVAERGLDILEASL